MSGRSCAIWLKRCCCSRKSSICELMSSCGETNHQWKTIRYTSIATISSSTTASNRRLRVSGIRRILASSRMVRVAVAHFVRFRRRFGRSDLAEFERDVEAIFLRTRIGLNRALHTRIGKQFGFVEQTDQLRSVVAQSLQFDL